MLDARGAVVPAIVHWGADLGPLTEAHLAELADSIRRPVGPSSADSPLRAGIVPLLADGWTGMPGLDGRHDPADSSRLRRPALVLTDVQQGDGAVTVRLVDAGRLAVDVEYLLDRHGVLRSRSTITNLAAEPFELASVSTVVPVPARARERLDFTGTWANERRPQRAAIEHGTWLRESRHGRNGHDDSFVTAVGTAGFDFRDGEVWAFHLAFSGDRRSWIDLSPSAPLVAGLGELLAPGEVRLAADETYVSPWTMAAWSDAGLDGISHRFHSWFRDLPAHPATPRPLTLNTWEAVYFEQGLAPISELARAAASVGVERFVLDDGWMSGRRDATTALGDWTVDADRWPDGLGPLCDIVVGLGMQFGLWVEPEMVSLDSDLARDHPDWILRESESLPLSWRDQYVLDLSVDAAREHVRDAIDLLLRTHPIAYLKWDMNRDLLGGSVHRQVEATYRLIDELRQRHPHLEIESCSSGGARIDAAILERTQRVWPSDTNDAHDRQSIVRWTSLLVPLEYLGAHVGAARAHTSGRTHSLAFRLSTALFGHAGIEWDVRGCSEHELTALRTWSAAYREHRELLHNGTVVRDVGEHAMLGVVNAERTEAIVSIALLDTAARSGRSPVALPGLDPQRRYRVSRVDVGAEPGMAAAPEWWHDGSIEATGTALESVGLVVPVLHPDEAVVLHLTAL